MYYISVTHLFHCGLYIIIKIKTTCFGLTSHHQVLNVRSGTPITKCHTSISHITHHAVADIKLE
jgi:hypothetical protein